MNRSSCRSKPCVALAVLVAVVATALLIPSASVAAGKGCRDGAYCLWTKQNFEGNKLTVETNKLFNFPDFMNNKASSAKSRVGGDDYVYLFKGKNGNALTTCFQDGANVPVFGPQINNSISSADVKQVTCA